MMSIKPIETRYRGYRFRSRLEARWAVFFDTIGWEWEYEKEGFDLDGKLYLPDFWFPQAAMWAEVKGESFTDEEKALCRSLALHSKCTVLMFAGLPDWKPYPFYASDGIEEWTASPLFEETLRKCGHSPHFLRLLEHYRDEVEAGREAWLNAANAARSARFEYGESGSIY